MGTTRMHENSRHGVVDSSFRPHGPDNSYVAGSSVFTTANPTLAILALAFRLTEHLRERIGRYPRDVEPRKVGMP